jgi:hypothetical protein
MKARYEHDCVDCSYVGQYGRLDLYVHDDEHQQTVIARRGSEGGDYGSWAISALDESMADARFTEYRFPYYTALARHRRNLLDLRRTKANC